MKSKIMLKIGDFAIHKGQVVAIKEFGEKTAVKIKNLHNDREEIVDDFDLSPFTEKNANKLISMYNMRIHTINECLQYI